MACPRVLLMSRTHDRAGYTERCTPRAPLWDGGTGSAGSSHAPIARAVACLCSRCADCDASRLDASHRTADQLCQSETHAAGLSTWEASAGFAFATRVPTGADLPRRAMDILRAPSALGRRPSTNGLASGLGCNAAPICPRDLRPPLTVQVRTFGTFGRRLRPSSYSANFQICCALLIPRRRRSDRSTRQHWRSCKRAAERHARASRNGRL